MSAQIYPNERDWARRDWRMQYGGSTPFSITLVQDLREDWPRCEYGGVIWFPVAAAAGESEAAHKRERQSLTR
jgi:hypothetical protein